MSNIVVDKVLDAVTTGTSRAIYAGDSSDVRMFGEWSVGVTAGAVQFEASVRPNYTGTWASIGSTSFSAGAVTVVPGAAAQKLELALPYVRARIATPVSGGTVTVYIARRIS